MRAGLTCAAVVLVLASVGCQSQGPIGDAEREKLMTLGPLGPVPDSPGNAHADDPAAAELGWALFNDDQLSNPAGQLSCQTCHKQREAWSEEVPLSTTASGSETPRHSQPLTNVAYQQLFFWNGKSDSLWAQAYKAWMGGVHGVGEEVMPGTLAPRETVVAHIMSEYAETYSAVFGPFPEEPLSEDQRTEVLINCAKAVAAFERTLVSRNSALDRWIEGDEDALSEAQKRGATLFVGKGGCIECHSGPNLSDGWFHNIGLAPGSDGETAAEGVAITLADAELNLAGPHSDASAEVASEWLSELMSRYDEAALRGAHKTPTLRDVELRPFFGHNGDVTNLRDWIVRYRDAPMDEGAVGERDPAYQPRDLSDQDIDDLVEFMSALTGEPNSEDVLPF